MTPCCHVCTRNINAYTSYNTLSGANLTYLLTYILYIITVLVAGREKPEEV